ncbi:MAG TPA: hypothetical protein VHW23_44705 [Kofleriaceae bacterium]|nr:hypothetical protein [Kofleriaceae bacterium]
MATGVAAAAWIADRPGPPCVPPGAPPETLEPTYEVIGTITEVQPGGGCGIFLSVSQIRYGNAFALVVPCLDLNGELGPRFAVGDRHRLVVDGNDVVRAIEWNGHRYEQPTCLAVVMAPAEAFGHVAVTAPDLAYHAPGWHWAPARLRRIQ